MDEKLSRNNKMRNPVLWSRSIAIVCLLSFSGCSGSEPPSCSDSDVQTSAWQLVLKIKSGNPNEPIIMEDPESNGGFTISASGLNHAFDFTMSSARTAKYDDSIHKRWCQADLKVSYDPSKINPSAINNPPGPNHFDDSKIATVLDSNIQKYSFPSVLEYAVQRTDDGKNYVTLESPP